MSRNYAFSLVGLLVVGLIAMPAPASAEYRDLCDSSKVCDYTGPGAPVLDSDVCLDPAGQITLKGSTPCAAGAWPFHLRHGEVYDPMLGLVIAYIPLENACSVVGLCHEQYDAPGSVSTAQGICCTNGVCWPGYDCGGTILWCEDGVCNEDGTVTCFESSEL